MNVTTTYTISINYRKNPNRDIELLVGGTCAELGGIPTEYSYKQACDEMRRNFNASKTLSKKASSHEESAKCGNLDLENLIRDRLENNHSYKFLRSDPDMRQLKNYFRSETIIVPRLHFSGSFLFCAIDVKNWTLLEFEASPQNVFHRFENRGKRNGDYEISVAGWEKWGKLQPDLKVVDLAHVARWEDADDSDY